MNHYDRFSERAWEQMEDEADRLTEANRIELERRIPLDRASLKQAWTAYLESPSVSMRDIAELLVSEREYEKEQLGDAVRLDGLKSADHTELARWERDAVKFHAAELAERVTVEDVADVALEAEAEAHAEPEEI